jgi:hypothetical protein
VLVIVTGLDWSGIAGEGQGRWLVFAAVHLLETDLALLESRLAAARVDLRRPAGSVFKHSGSKDFVEERFFDAVGGVPFRAHVHLLDKTEWRLQHGPRANVADRVCDGIVHLTMSLPRDVVDDQILLIDVPRREGALWKSYRTAIRMAMRGARRPSFRDVRPRPDDRLGGEILQVADMIAGEVRQHEGIGGLYLPVLRSRIELV